MASFIKLGITALLVLGVVVGNAGVGWAGAFLGCPACTVKIDDLTESPAVNVINGLQQDVTGLFLVPQPDSAGEFLHFTLPLLAAPVQSFYSDLFEDHLGGLSDRLVVTVGPSGNVLDVQFASDPALFPTPPTGATHVTPDLVENGGFQDLFTVAVGLPGSFAYDFQVRSDVVETPAPGTLFLIGAGLVGLAVVGWRRKRS